MKDANASITLRKNDLKKIQALDRIQTHDLCVTGAMLYQLSHQGGHVWVRPFMFSGRNTWLKYLNITVIGVTYLLLTYFIFLVSQLEMME